MSDVVDISQALDQAGGSAELARDLFGMLLADLPDLQARVNAAFADGDHEALWDHTHKIHGATAYCGVPALREAAHAMEQAIKAGDGTDLEAPLAALNRAIDALLEQGPAILESGAWD